MHNSINSGISYFYLKVHWHFQYHSLFFEKNALTLDNIPLHGHFMIYLTILLLFPIVYLNKLSCKTFLCMHLCLCLTVFIWVQRKGKERWGGLSLGDWGVETQRHKEIKVEGRGPGNQMTTSLQEERAAICVNISP